MGVGAIVCFLWENASNAVMYEFFKHHSKGDDEFAKKYNTMKGCRTFWQIQYFSVAAIWGYIVLKPTGWLPWEIGGDKTIFEAYKDSLQLDKQPYMHCPRPVIVYALGTMGYHFGDSVF